MATAGRNVQRDVFDLGQPANVWEFEVSDALTVSLAARVRIGTLSTGIMAIEWSSDGSTWSAFDPAESFTSGILSVPNLNVAGVNRVRVRTSTAQSGVELALSASLKGEV